MALLLQAPAFACSCSSPFSNRSEFLHLGEDSSITLPADALGILFLRDPELDIRDRDSRGNDILGSVPPRLEPANFMIHDLTAGRRLKAVLTPLGLDIQLGHPRSYFLFKESGDKDRLRDISGEVRLAKGLFRVRPAGGFVEGHKYMFTLTPIEAYSLAMAQVSVGPPLQLTAADRIALVPQGRPASEMLTMAAGGMCSAARARIVQRLAYVLPKRRQPYQHLLMTFTSQQFFGRELNEFELVPGEYVQTAYSSHMCGSGRSSLGISELGQGKDLVSVPCPAFGVKAERRLVRGHVGMLELDDALHTTPALDVGFAKADGLVCTLNRLREALFSES
ncbi:MAG: hypothetical protein Q7S67_04000 [Telluria sp.]|nr:hypothetical protein [Telluria sp.]